MTVENLFANINFKDGLIPAIIVDDDSNTVLTLCYLNETALRKSLETGIVHLFRRSKGKLMKKGETSGHVQEIKEVGIDCAGNSLLLRVNQKVAACHKGYFSCFYRTYNAEDDSLEARGEKIFEPGSVY